MLKSKLSFILVLCATLVACDTTEDNPSAGGSEGGNVGGADAGSEGGAVGGAEGGAVAGTTACEGYCFSMDQAGCFEFGSAIGFDSTESCLSACALYNTSGQEGDFSGNTLQCRIQHAQMALMFKDVNNGDVHCTHAGIDGGNVCVDVAPTTEEQLADNYCSKLTRFCAEQAAGEFTDCASEVTALLTNSTFNIEGRVADTTGASIQCLTNTAILAGISDQALCTEALPSSTTVCVD